MTPRTHTDRRAASLGDALTAVAAWAILAPLWLPRVAAAWSDALHVDLDNPDEPH